MAKARKAAKNSGKAAAKKSVTSRKKRMGKPASKPAKAHKGKAVAHPRRAAGKSARNSARMTPRKTARMAVRNPQAVMAMLPPAFAAMVRGRNGESIISVLVVLFMVIATLSAGYFYPQPKAAAVATPAIVQVK